MELEVQVDVHTSEFGCMSPVYSAFDGHVLIQNSAQSFRTLTTRMAGHHLECSKEDLLSQTLLTAVHQLRDRLTRQTRLARY